MSWRAVTRCVFGMMAAALALTVGCGDKDNNGEAGGADVPVAPKAPPGFEVLKLDLPKVEFRSTPENLRAENLEAPRKAGQPRPVLFVPKGVQNVAMGKPVTTNVAPGDMLFKLEFVTDGSKSPDEFVALSGPAPRWVQIDLEQPCEVYAIAVWHYHKEFRIYRDVIVQIGTDPDFITEGDDYVTVFNNDHDNSLALGIGTDKAYIDGHEGRIMDAKGAVARYVRLYANGYDTTRYTNENSYVEVEVYGKPVGETP